MEYAFVYFLVALIYLLTSLKPSEITGHFTSVCVLSGLIDFRSSIWHLLICCSQSLFQEVTTETILQYPSHIIHSINGQPILPYGFFSGKFLSANICVVINILTVLISKIMRCRSGGINLILKCSVCIDICFQSECYQFIKIRIQLWLNTHCTIPILNQIINTDAHKVTDLNLCSVVSSASFHGHML